MALRSIQLYWDEQPNSDKCWVEDEWILTITDLSWWFGWKCVQLLGSIAPICKPYENITIEMGKKWWANQFCRKLLVKLLGY